ncbi:MAG: GNAT family N-acetyltransferase [Anaerolineales bacterium]
MSASQKTRFIIRQATDNDLKACLALDASVETDHIWQMQWREMADGHQIRFQTMRLPRPTQVDYPRDTGELHDDLQTLTGMLVAYAEAGPLLGYAHMMLIPADKSAWLRNLVVDRPWRRHRIGRALLAQAKVWARAQGANHLTTEATTKNYPAIQFMLQQGFIFCGFNDRYYTSQDIAVFFGQNI